MLANMKATDFSTELDAGVATFAQRLATRELPKPVRFGRASVEDGVMTWFPNLHHLTYFRLTGLLYAFLSERQQSVVALAEEFGLGTSATRRIVWPLLEAGLLVRDSDAADARQKILRLMRAGEDWLQTLVQAPVPDATNVASFRQTRDNEA